jgi:dTDP-4-amino-4,6-dideoxygalactose transaminase
MFNTVTNFEKTIGEYFGAPYAVATDCCTHAVELCLRLKKPKNIVCPTNTYVSIPMTLLKLGIDFDWKDVDWKEYYYLENSNIIDAAVLWRENSYVPGTMMCVSFQFRKHLNLGRGGIILLDNKEEYEELIKMVYDGRERDIPWAEQNIDTIGYHYYMTPEIAEEGLKKFKEIKDIPPKHWSNLDYPDLSKLKVFENVK